MLKDKISYASRPLVPKLYLGTPLSAKLCFTPQAKATKLRGHQRSQVQLGNEEMGRPSHVSSKPEASDNPSRRLSPLRAIPPGTNLKELYPVRGTTSVRPPPGSIAEKDDHRWCHPPPRVQPPARMVKSLQDFTNEKELRSSYSMLGGFPSLVPKYNLGTRN